jgi:3-hydroxyacyl-CoA dehydrogenase
LLYRDGIDSFITGRLLIPYLRKSCFLTSESWLIVFPVEAIRMAERGDANPQDIDRAMEFGAGYREYFFAWNDTCV